MWWFECCILQRPVEKVSTQHVMIVMLYLIETRREGTYQTGDVLFTSQTNSVNVRFTSDDNVRGNGFWLDVRSTACTEGTYWCQIHRLYWRYALMSDPPPVLKVRTDVRSTACTEGTHWCQIHRLYWRYVLMSDPPLVLKVRTDVRSTACTEGTYWCQIHRLYWRYVLMSDPPLVLKVGTDVRSTACTEGTYWCRVGDPGFHIVRDIKFLKLTTSFRFCQWSFS